VKSSHTAPAPDRRKLLLHFVSSVVLSSIVGALLLFGWLNATSDREAGSTHGAIEAREEVVSASSNLVPERDEIKREGPAFSNAPRPIMDKAISMLAQRQRLEHLQRHPKLQQLLSDWEDTTTPSAQWEIKP